MKIIAMQDQLNFNVETFTMSTTMFCCHSTYEYKVHILQNVFLNIMSHYMTHLEILELEQKSVLRFLRGSTGFRLLLFAFILVGSKIFKWEI